MSGRLSLVAVPLGNADDITIRALRTLSSAAIVAAEDTRTTGTLLAHHRVTARLISFHDHNEAERVPELLAHLIAGEPVAVVSEAGTPLVNDPGFRLVRAAVEAGIVVEVLPGPCAAVAALVGSALPVDRWMYAGFFPRSSGDRARMADELGGVATTLVFYESPVRLPDTLDWLAATWPDRAICVARNMTKPYEQWIRGTPAEARAVLGDETRGEVVVVIGPPVERPLSEDPAALIERLLARGMDARATRDAVAEAAGISKKEAYRLVLSALGRG